MNIIDSHIHFWDPKHLRYEWLDDVQPLNKVYLPKDLPNSGDGWSLEKLVFVQADALPEQGFNEVRWVNELATEDNRIQAIVAFAPLENHNFHAALEVMQDMPKVKGIRRLIQSEGRGFATKKHFIDAVRALPDYGFSFDICVRHNQLPDILLLVEHCPNVAFVLDHIGKPDIKNGEFDIWQNHITKLAEFENVQCKLSGIITEADTDNWTPAQLQPYIDHVLEAFGTNRLMFGGDYPVLELANITYGDWVKIALATLASLSETEKTKIFYENASNFYHLG